MRRIYLCLFSCLSILIFLMGMCSCSSREYKKVEKDGDTISSSMVESISAPSYSVDIAEKDKIDSKGITVKFVADRSDGKFYKVLDKKMTSVYISGVNMGLTSATTDLNNPDVDYDTYINWFSQISQMNANTVRVFTEMPPQFYKAFLDYNKSAENPLYLMHGIWFNENFMYEDPADCWDKEDKVINAFEKSAKETADIIHGKCRGISYGNIENAEYKYDVSKWLAGYILGLEWNPSFVETSNSHFEKSSYKGDFLSTKENAEPFEAFLCRAGDTLIKYETKKYNHQAPVAFLNWVTTDTLIHSNEPDKAEDSVSVNTENIVSNSKYYAGQFAAIDIYPYYPESINFQKEYVSYKDPLTGKKDNYKAYLLDLKKEYSVPIIVAEFGLPTSRGCASKSVLGYNQGKITEEQQGNCVSNMIVDIASSGYAGGLIFSWQDEWFKQTWNTYRYAPENPQQRTPNKMSAEQSYGILAMEAGSTDICFVDGKTNEWNGTDIVINNENCQISTKYDEAYLYLYVKLNKDNTFENSKVLIPVSTIGIGSTKIKKYGVIFNKNTDFVILVDGQENTCVLNDENYDYFYYRYGVESKYFPLPKDFAKKNSGTYGIVKQFVSGEMVLPETSETKKAIINDAGKLVFGISDPDSDSFNSLSDFYAKDNVIEMRIAWNLLNVLNISEGVAMNNFNKDGFAETEKFTDIFIGGDIADSNTKRLELMSIGYKTSDKSSFHTRLKKSYGYIQKTLENLHSKENQRS